jgi:hypothetical protein
MGLQFSLGRRLRGMSGLAVLVVEALEGLGEPGLAADLAALPGGGVQLGGGDLLVLGHVQGLVQGALLPGRPGDPLLLLGQGGLLRQENGRARAQVRAPTAGPRLRGDERRFYWARTVPAMKPPPSTRLSASGA